MELHHRIVNPFLLVLERECRGDARGVQVSRLREKHRPRGSLLVRANTILESRLG